ncbi:DUF817 domain-containing protein [Coraliomargarita sinensis]|uniref:DUF817 domain-containing protein n=1 Tax=Coraliomargarita sinensis TaxID=2174842 RepID=A0A317ZIB7_9BACT|nr:DUF817 domain-containing protein [Coraliomargarita sinensis]PXA05464.1 DUF817 domain-containing protein [Coraliomargarita sinensis]
MGIPWAEELLLFGLKQAWACVFGAALLVGIIGTKFWYPDIGLHRYDFLFCYAVSIQLLLLIFRLESLREVGVIFLFHLMATAMELFKTHDAIGSWSYPGEAFVRIGNVPLFAGFMYSAVGSYLARVWRGFEFKFENFPSLWVAGLLAGLSYINFFTHHFVPDIRWFLIAGILLAFARTQVLFRPDKMHRRMPLLFGFALVSLFIWIAENLGTYAKAWIYPHQANGWQWIGVEKWTAWFLLMQLSFVLIYALRCFEAWLEKEGKLTAVQTSGPKD